MIEDVAEAAGLEGGMFETEVVVNDDIESAILANIKKYDTVCVGVSERRAVSKILWGSLADRIVENAEGNVALIRGEYEIHRSIREGIVERLSD